MPTYSTPGVYVSESTLVSNTQRSNTAISTPVFFGTAPRGPLSATLINSWSDFKSIYGDISANHELGYSVYHFFANGGREAYIVRVLHTSGSGAIATTATATVPYYPTGSGSASGSLLTLSATSPGAWADGTLANKGLSVKVNSDNRTGAVTATASVIPTFNLTIYLDNVEVERWNEISTDPANNRYAPTVLNTYSQYVSGVVGASAGSATAASATWEFITTEKKFSAAVDGGAVVAADYTSAFSSKLETIEGVLLLNAVGQTSSTVVNALIAKAETRGNSFVIIDPSTSTDTATIGAGTVQGYTASSYAAVYYPMLKMADPTKTGPAAIRDTYPGGAVVGAYIRSEITRTVAKAPAGYGTDVRNAIGLTATFTPTEVDDLYAKYGVNLFKSVPGAGVIINGTRTLDKLSPGKYIPIRRSLNYIKQSLKDSTQFAVFEPNDQRLWDRISMTAAAFLGEFWRAGGLKGSNSADAFYVTCNSTTNTSTSINNGEVRLEVGVALQYPAEFIVINVSQWTGGSNTVSNL